MSADGDAVSKIAGNVVSSPDAGRAMKAWREKLGIRQKALADSLRISASVLSDYESGRRPSPGVKFVRKYIEALVRLDEGKGRVVPTLISSERDEAILS
ncbi:MAG: helix-turn-helix domain-containing protein, partial [Thaumarchaeota archaeon]|nr:helix-turn-helix domain-containing protein [Nitrososphaerota archaeon]